MVESDPRPADDEAGGTPEDERVREVYEQLTRVVDYLKRWTRH